ncbi:MAG: SAM-dependent methyltransferase [Candidatus Micrarchaeia archaeon]
MTRCIRFDRLQERVNISYYRKVQDIYADFKTFGSCSKVPYANAIEFLHNFYDTWDGHSEINVYELGVGNGLFALNFLDGIAKVIGHKNPFLKHMNYFLCDVSFNNISFNVEKNLAKFNIDFIPVNISKSISFLRKPLYVRSNEMYDDIPARIFVKDRDGIKEVFYNNDLDYEYYPAKGISAQVLSHVSKMPLGYHIPANIKCSDSICNIAKRILPGGYFDVYDYGFSSISEVKEFSKDAWNANIIRKYGTQLTVDINFMLLSSILFEKGIDHTLSTQKSYTELILGEKLFYLELDNLYYLSAKELAQNKHYIRKFGYSYKQLLSGIEEKDDYMHLRVFSKKHM